MSYLDNINKEFQTVDLLIQSNVPTRYTDAFIISWVKVEKQVRKIFTYLIFQYPSLSRQDVHEIIKVVSSKKYLYFENFIKGFDAIYPDSFENIIRPQYKQFISDKQRIKKFRNKILHGQLTGQGLSAQDLDREISVIRRWCTVAGKKMNDEIYYDGFGRNLFRKSVKKDLSTKYKIGLNNVTELSNFIISNMK